MSDTEYISADELGTGGVIAAEGSSDFKPPCDVLLALRPFGRKTINAPGIAKPFDVIETYCVQITDEGTYVDIGLRDVGWEFVMRELDKSTPEAPWVIGTITKKSRAYFLVPPTVEQMKAASEGIATMLEDRRAEEEQAAAGIATAEDAFGVEAEEPF